MSDLKLFNYKNESLYQKTFIDRQTLKDIIEKNALDLLGITVIAANVRLSEEMFEEVETIGYDENHQIVVIEYRFGKFSSTINKGLVILDYIKNNQGKFKTFINERVGYDLGKEIKLSARLISIGDDYNHYDEYAIKQMPFDIELIKYQLFNKSILVLEKNYQSAKISILENYNFKSKEESQLYKQISEFVLSLGDEVSEQRFDGYCGYRKIKNFLYLIFDENIKLNIKLNNKYKSINIKNYKDFEKTQNLIEQSYDEN